MSTEVNELELKTINHLSSVDVWFTSNYLTVCNLISGAFNNYTNLRHGQCPDVGPKARIHHFLVFLKVLLISFRELFGAR